MTFSSGFRESTILIKHDFFTSSADIIITKIKFHQVHLISYNDHFDVFEDYLN